MAVVETKVHLNEVNITQLQDVTVLMKAQSNTSFAEVKESLIHLRSVTEHQARTQEALAGRVDAMSNRVGALEINLALHKSDTDKTNAVLRNDLEKVDSGWKTEKNRMMAYISGVVLVVTGLWSVFGGSVKTFLGQ